jgi:hypothetical protein
VEDVAGDDRVRHAGELREVDELDSRGEAGDRRIPPHLDRELRVGMQRVRRARVEHRLRREYRLGREVTDHDAVTDALTIARADLPADTRGAAAERGPPLAELNGEGGVEARLDVRHGPGPSRHSRSSSA